MQWCFHIFQHWKDITSQKKIFKITFGAQPRTPCRSLCLKKLEILSVLLKYKCSLMNFIVNSEGKSQMNSCVHITDTRNKHHLYRPDATSSCFQKSTVCASITICNISACNLTSLRNEKAESKLILR